MNKDLINKISFTNRILLGLVMLIPGLTKMFVFTPNGVANMLNGFGFPIPLFFAWVLALSEIIFGLAIISNWKIKYSIIPPIIILLVSLFISHWGDWTRVIMHLILVTNYLLLAYSKR